MNEIYNKCIERCYSSLYYPNHKKYHKAVRFLTFEIFFLTRILFSAKICKHIYNTFLRRCVFEESLVSLDLNASYFQIHKNSRRLDKSIRKSFDQNFMSMRICVKAFISKMVKWKASWPHPENV